MESRRLQLRVKRGRCLRGQRANLAQQPLRAAPSARMRWSRLVSFRKGLPVCETMIPVVCEFYQMQLSPIS